MLGTEKGKGESKGESKDESKDESNDEFNAASSESASRPSAVASGASMECMRHIFTQGAQVFTRVHGIGARSCLWVYDGARVKDFLEIAAVASEGALGALLASYRFDKYLTEDEHDERSLKLQSLGIALSGMNYSNEERAAAYASSEALTSGIFFARDLVNEPPNALSRRTMRRFCERL